MVKLTTEERCAVEAQYLTDISRPLETRRTRRYVLLREQDGETHYIVAAARMDRGGRTAAKAVLHHVLGRDRSDVRDYTYWSRAGWIVYWPDDMSSHCPMASWAWSADEEDGWLDYNIGLNAYWGKPVGAAAAEYGAELNASPCKHLLAYLMLVREFPGVRQLCKCGFGHLASRPFLRRLAADPGLAKFIRANGTFIRARGTTANMIAYAYRNSRLPISRAVTEYVRAAEARRAANAERRARAEAERQAAEARRKKRHDYERNKRLRAVALKFDDIRKIPDETYTIELPTKISDFETEGHLQNNCLCRPQMNWPQKVAAGECLIVFLRKDGFPSVDLEIDPAGGGIRQCYASSNRKAPTAAWKLARKISETVSRMRTA